MKPWLAMIMTTAVTCAPVLQWTRLIGTVKGVNLKESTLTIQNHDGDLLIVPIDYQVKLVEKKDILRGLKDLQLDQKVTLLRVPADKAIDEADVMNPGPLPQVTH